MWSTGTPICMYTLCSEKQLLKLDLHVTSALADERYLLDVYFFVDLPLIHKRLEVSDRILRLSLD